MWSYKHEINFKTSNAQRELLQLHCCCCIIHLPWLWASVKLGSLEAPLRVDEVYLMRLSLWIRRWESLLVANDGHSTEGTTMGARWVRSMAAKYKTQGDRRMMNTTWVNVHHQCRRSDASFVRWGMIYSTVQYVYIKTTFMHIHYAHVSKKSEK